MYTWIIQNRSQTFPSYNDQRVEVVTSHESSYMDNILHVGGQEKLFPLEFGSCIFSISVRLLELRSFFEISLTTCDTGLQLIQVIPVTN